MLQHTNNNDDIDKDQKTWWEVITETLLQWYIEPDIIGKTGLKDR
jgi:hypothetical protein